MRLNKFISDSGFCSRREADKYIEEKRVTINKVVATLGDRVKGGDKVRVNGRLIEGNDDDYVYLALNKPVGISSTTDTSDKSNVVDFINYPTRIFHIGRLDKDSEGLLLLTNDGDIVNKILRAGNNHEKEYEVWVDKDIDAQFIERMSKGVRILGTTTKPCKIEKEGARKFRIFLTQGLNRQIRRMCEVFGYQVVRLKRVRIMNITLGGLATGQWRELKSVELEQLFNSLKDSDGEESASAGAGAGKRVPRAMTGKKNEPKSSSGSFRRGGSSAHGGANRSARTSSSRKTGNKPTGRSSNKPTGRTTRRTR